MYETALPFLKSKPTWLSNVDQQDRMAAYDFYDDLLDNSPTQQRLMLRGDQDDIPIYVPTPKQVVKTLARYVARGLSFAVGAEGVDPATGAAIEISTEDQVATAAAFSNLFKRERFFSRFKANKRWGLARGDMCIYVIADPVKASGSRISLKHIDPRMYFPIVDTDDPDRILGCDLVSQLDFDKKQYVRRERYVKASHPDHPMAGTDGTSPVDAPIAHEIVYLAADGWDDPEKAKLAPAGVGTPLAMEVMPGIMALPVYHIKIDEEPGNPYGRSVMNGMERIFLGINQAITDEDIALAMAGLGFYMTDQRLEDEGDDWVIGPKRVVELSQNGKFERVSGVPSVEPSQKHLGYLKSEVFQTVGINDVALGSVDSAVAESGIALQLRLGPIIDESNEIDQTITDVLTQMFYDLATSWFPTYESMTFAPGVQVLPTYEDKIPANKQKEIGNLFAMLEARVISSEFFRTEYTRITGTQFPDDMEAEIAKDVEMADPLGQRATNELAIE